MPALLNSYAFGGAAGGVANVIERYQQWQHQNQLQAQEHEFRLQDETQRQNFLQGQQERAFQQQGQMAHTNEALQEQEYKAKQQIDDQMVQQRTNEVTALEQIQPGLKQMHDQFPEIRQAYIYGGQKAALQTAVRLKSQQQAIQQRGDQERQTAAFKAQLQQQNRQPQAQYVQDAAARYPNDARMQEAARGFGAGVVTPAQVGEAALQAATPGGAANRMLPMQRQQVESTMAARQLDPTLPKDFQSFSIDKDTSNAELIAAAQKPQIVAAAFKALQEDPNQHVNLRTGQPDPTFAAATKAAQKVLDAVNYLPRQTNDSGWLWRRYKSLTAGGVDPGALHEYQQDFLIKKIDVARQMAAQELQAKVKGMPPEQQAALEQRYLQTTADVLNMSTAEFIEAARAAQALRETNPNVNAIQAADQAGRPYSVNPNP